MAILEILADGFKKVEETSFCAEGEEDGGRRFEERRFFCADDELIHAGGKNIRLH
jgi:hypothetical protein